VLVPLDASRDMLDVAAALDLPVLLVVGLRLGCLNHTLLSALAIRRRGLELRGWIANRLSAPMRLADANIATLAERLGAPAAIIESPDDAQLSPDTLRRLGLVG
jgi:dethiobiotin synthetase